MKTHMTKDARGFVEGIVKYLKQDGKTTASTPKVETLLAKVSKNAQREHIADVESAVTLTPEEKLRLGSILSRFIGHDLEIVMHTNTALLGGLRIKIADLVIDTSLESKLYAMAQTLL